jgi:hypothetical protein
MLPAPPDVPEWAQKTFDFEPVPQRTEAYRAKWAMRDTCVGIIDIDEEDVEEPPSDPRWLR